MRGVSFIAVMLALLTLSVFGASLVAIVATEQDVRTNEYQRLRAFYIAMTGLEYGLREVVTGGYPNATNQPFAGGTFTTQVIPASHLLTVAAVSGVAQRNYQVTVPLLAGDCAGLDTTGSVPIGRDRDEINRVKIRKFCLNKVRIDKLQFTWIPNTGQRLIQVDLDNVTIFNNPSGTPSGGIADVTDTVIADSSEHQFNRIIFSANIVGVTMTMTVIFSDGSVASATWFVPDTGS